LLHHPIYQWRSRQLRRTPWLVTRIPAGPRRRDSGRQASEWAIGMVCTASETSHRASHGSDRNAFAILLASGPTISIPFSSSSFFFVLAHGARSKYLPTSRSDTGSIPKLESHGSRDSTLPQTPPGGLPVETHFSLGKREVRFCLLYSGCPQTGRMQCHFARYFAADAAV